MDNNNEVKTKDFNQIINEFDESIKTNKEIIKEMENEVINLHIEFLHKQIKHCKRLIIMGNCAIILQCIYYVLMVFFNKIFFGAIGLIFLIIDFNTNKINKETIIKSYSDIQKLESGGSIYDLWKRKY